MEPPMKRRRKGESPWDQDEGGEDDELSLQPLELVAQRDPDYKLSIERAYADQRFQATMSHIFEKYGRDFDGIGDEIDLETGEIVVNNGHVHNMRNEADVGDGWVVEEGDEADEGFLLEDLIDNEEAENGDLEDHNDDDSDQHDDSKGDEDTDDDEEERIMQGRRPPTTSTALIRRRPLHAPFGGPGAQSLTLFPGLSSSPFGLPQNSFGLSPFGAHQWDLPDHPSGLPWDHPDFTAASRTPVEQLPFKASRYNFPVQDGRSSIWAPRSRFRGNEDQPQQSPFSMLGSKRSKPRKSLPPPHSKVSQNEDDDEDVIITGRTSIRESELLPPMLGNANDHDVQLTLSARTSSPERADSGVGEESAKSHQIHKVASSVSTSKKRKRTPSIDRVQTELVDSESGSESEEGLSSDEDSEHSSGEDFVPLNGADVVVDQEENLGRRRSGRVRKHVEFPDKIPWTEVLAKSRGQKMIVDLPHLDPQRRDDYMSFDIDVNLDEIKTANEPSAANQRELHLGDENISTSLQDAASSSSTRIIEVQDPVAPLPVETVAILDSEEGYQSSHNDTVPGDATGPSSKKPDDSGPFDKDSACILSDDEAPTFLSKPRRIGANDILEDKESDIFSLEDSTGSTVATTVEIEGIEEMLQTKADHESPSDDSQLFEESTLVADIENFKASPKRPNKDARAAVTSPLDRSIIDLEEATIPPSDDLHGLESLSSSPTSFISRIAAEASLRDKPKRLGREIEWLRRRTAGTLSPNRMITDCQNTTEPPRSQAKERRPRRPAIPAEQEQSATDYVNNRRRTPFGLSSSPVSVKNDGSHMKELPAEAILPSPRRTASPVQPDQRISTESPCEQTSQPYNTQKPISAALSSSPTKPQTPRHYRHTLKIPSSRRSILSLLSDNEEDDEVDELGRNLAAVSKLVSSGVKSNLSSNAAQRIWKSSTRTREVYHTPVKKRPSEAISPGSVVKTPGGTLRACGFDGYRCGRDFCFTCL